MTADYDKLKKEMTKLDKIFIDTAPFIYHVESNPEFRVVTRYFFDLLDNEEFKAITSTITLTEVLTKPFEIEDEKVIRTFSTIIIDNKKIDLFDIDYRTAIDAARLRANYSFVKTMDAIQIAAALNHGADGFMTNDNDLKKVNEGLEIIVLMDFLQEE